MISSNSCWLKSSCNKHIKEPEFCDNDTFCMKLFKIDDLLDKSLLSNKQKNHVTLFPDANGVDYDKFIQLKEIENNIVDFVNKGKNLYIHSSICGNGKTAWSIRLIQTYIEKIWYKSDLVCKALFINVPRYLQALKDSISNPDEYVDYVKNNILQSDLVVWDELGIKNCTQFEFENLLNMINTRIDLGKSNIYTSNLKGEELLERLGDRLYSRIINLSYDIELNGVDKRGLSK